MSETNVQRLNWGCGDHVAPGWVNCDIKDDPWVDVVADIRTGLPMADNTFDYVTSIHALPELPLPELVPVLQELHRVLKPNGTLRLSLPDLDKGIRAYQAGDREYFLIPDEDAQAMGSKLIVQLLWYGWSRSLFTADFVEELLRRAGFRDIQHCSYRVTASRHPDIIDLDNREAESLFVEATK